jgi:hypothetical protein
MTWEAISAEDVSALSGVRESDLLPLWYDMAVAILADVCEVHHIANLTTVTDTVNGSGTSSLRVRKPPINSVSSVTVNSVVIPGSSYTHDKSSVILIDEISANPYLSDQVFDLGVKNVVVEYVSGEVDNAIYALAVALIIKEIASLKIGEAADGRIQFGSTGKSDGKALSRKYVGVHVRVIDIAKTLFSKRLRAR